MADLHVHQQSVPLQIDPSAPSDLETSIPPTWERLIATIALQIRASLNLPTILQTTANQVYQLIQSDRVLVYQFNPDWSGQVVVETISDPQWSLLNQVVHDPCFEASWIQPFQEQRVWAISDCTTAGISPCHAEFLAGFQVRANLVVPVLCEDPCGNGSATRLWGLLIAHYCTAPHPWTVAEIHGLQQIAIHLGIAIQQANLIAQLQTAKTELEAQVSTRTQELHQANQQLARQVEAYANVTATLQQREEFLRQLLDSLMTFVAVLTPDGILIEVNQAPLAIAGLRRADVIGTPFAETYWWSYSPEAQHQIRSAIAQAKQGDSVRFDIPFQIKNSEQIVIDFCLNPLRDSRGQITHLIPSGVDISDRLRAETARQQISNQLVQQLTVIEAAIDGIAIVQDDCFQYLNPSHVQMFGYDSVEELMGQSWRILYHPDQIEYFEQTIFPILETQRAWQGEAIATRKDGSTFYEEVSLTLTQQGNLICVCRDVTQRKQAELDLQQSELANRALISAIPDFLVRMRQDGLQVQMMNHGAVHLLHDESFVIDGRRIADLMPAPVAEERIRLAQEAIATGQMQRQEYTFEHKGITYYEEARIVPYQDDEVLVVVRDVSDRKRAELQLRHLSERLDIAVKSAQMGIWDWDIQHNSLIWDDRMYELYGLSPDVFMGTHEAWEACLHPDDQAYNRHLTAAVLAGNQDYNTEFRICRPDGSMRYIKSYALVQRDAQNRAVRMIGANFDITDRKGSDLALQQSEARYRHIIETTLEGVWMLDADGNTTFVNQRMADLLGGSMAELIGKPLMHFIDPSDRPQAQQYLDRRQQGIEEQHPFKFRRLDGPPLWAIVSATPLWDEHSLYMGSIALLTDITELVTVQEALKTSEMQLSSVLNSSLDGIMAFRAIRDDQGSIIDFEWLFSNPTACQLVDRQVEDLIGKRLLVEMPGHWGEGLFDDYVHVVNSGEPNQREFYYNHDGIEAWFENVAVKLGDGFAVTFRNVTAIKQSKQAVQQANQQLEERIADLDQRHTEMLILSEISDFLQACLTVEEAYTTLSSLVQPLFPGCSGGLFITSASRNRVEQVSTWGGSVRSVMAFQPQDCWALRRGRMHHFELQRPGLRCNHTANHRAIATSLCIPMIAQGETLGLFYLSADTAAALPEAKRQLARTVAEQMALAISNLYLRETLRHQSICDPLTGLFNRRYLEESLTQEIARAQRHHYPIGVIMIDVDHFKGFNDKFGHDAGDYVLQLVGTYLKDSVRGSDVVCRYGGEELTVILPESTLEQTAQRAEMIRREVAALPLAYNGQYLGNLTISLGVAAYPEHGSTGAALLQTADAALYRAKGAGRNRVMTAP